MTRTTNARIAGFTFLFYIAAGIYSMVLSRRAAGEGIAAKLAAVAQHEADMRIVVLLSILTCMSALVLGVTLWALTREQDPELAMLGLICRVAEGVIGVGLPVTLGLMWLATAKGGNAPEPASAQAIGAFLLKLGAWRTLIGATMFAVGSALFSWLLLRGRMIPVVLAWLGVIASVLLVIGLPLQLAGYLHGRVTWLMWIPMAAFEVPLGLWLMVKGVAAPASARVARDASLG